MAKVWVRSLGRPRVKRVGYDANAAVFDANPDLVDLNDGKVRQTLSGTRNRWVVLPDKSINLTRAGNVAIVSTASGLTYVAPKDLTIYRVIASVGTAPATDPIIIDVHRVAAGGAATAAGTTIFTTQSRRPTIAAATTVSAVNHATNGVPEVQAISAGDILRVEIDAIGTGTVGANLVVQILGY
jgi:hypothetical protein